MQETNRTTSRTYVRHLISARYSTLFVLVSCVVGTKTLSTTSFQTHSVPKLVKSRILLSNLLCT